MLRGDEGGAKGVACRYDLEHGFVRHELAAHGFADRRVPFKTIRTSIQLLRRVMCQSARDCRTLHSIVVPVYEIYPKS